MDTEEIHNIITNYLDFVSKKAEEYDTNSGWSMSDLIDLSCKYVEEVNKTYITTEEAWSYLKRGVTVFYRWEKSKEWYQLNNETVDGAVALLERDDYKFAIE